MSGIPRPDVPSGPTLTGSPDDWVGTFPGLGSITIDANGGSTVDVGIDDDRLAVERAEALRHGWAELLSFARRGYSMAAGAVLTPGREASRALLVCGDPPEVAAVALGLTTHGWALVSDRPTPTRWEHGELVAHPRPAPLIVGRHVASLAGRDGPPVRTGSDALAIEVSRRSTPVQVSAVARVQRRRPDEDVLTELHGHRRFERAALIMMGGVLAPHGADADPAGVVDQHVQLAGLPWCEVRLDDSDEAVDALIAWWAGRPSEPA